MRGTIRIKPPVLGRVEEEPRSWTLSRHAGRTPISRRKLDDLGVLRRLLGVYEDGAPPRTRGECPASGPCPWVLCRHHLYLDLEGGSLKLTWAGAELHELPETCALDVAARGGATLEDIGACLGVTRERVRQIEEEAAQKVCREAEL